MPQIQVLYKLSTFKGVWGINHFLCHVNNPSIVFWNVNDERKHAAIKLKMKYKIGIVNYGKPALNLRFRPCRSLRAGALSTVPQDLACEWKEDTFGRLSVWLPVIAVKLLLS